jgi:ribosome-associated heat shock protein Hsp15
MRIDKWLWAVRIFKSRTLSAETCSKGKVTVNKHTAKPAQVIKLNDDVSYSYGALTRTFKVIAIPTNRVSAKDVNNYCLETTPAEVLMQHAAMRKATAVWRDKGSGRPTKKDRRELDDFIWEGSFEI